MQQYTGMIPVNGAADGLELDLEPWGPQSHPAPAAAQKAVQPAQQAAYVSMWCIGDVAAGRPELDLEAGAHKAAQHLNSKAVHKQYRQHCDGSVQ